MKAAGPCVDPMTHTCWCWAWAADCRFWSCSEPPCVSSALCCHRWSSGWCRLDTGHLGPPCCLVLPKHDVHTHTYQSKHTQEKKSKSCNKWCQTVSEKEREEKEHWECQHKGQIQQKQLSFDLCNIALGSALGLHFQKPVTMTQGSERSRRLLEMVKHLNTSTVSLEKLQRTYSWSQTKPSVNDLNNCLCVMFASICSICSSFSLFFKCVTWTVLNMWNTRLFSFWRWSFSCWTVSRILSVILHSWKTLVCGHLSPTGRRRGCGEMRKVGVPVDLFHLHRHTK